MKLYSLPGLRLHIKHRIVDAEGIDALAYGLVTWIPKYIHHASLDLPMYHRGDTPTNGPLHTLRQPYPRADQM